MSTLTLTGDRLAASVRPAPLELFHEVRLIDREPLPDVQRPGVALPAEREDLAAADYRGGPC